MNRKDDPFCLTLDGLPEGLEFSEDSLSLESNGTQENYPGLQLCYKVTIRGEQFAYSVGTAHALPMPDGWGHSVLFPRRIRRKGWTPSTFARSFPVDYVLWLRSGKAHPDISLLDVLMCLLSDRDAGTLEFREFCEEFGYTDGNRADAYETWQACQANARKVARILSAEEMAILETAREDW